MGTLKLPVSRTVNRLASMADVYTPYTVIGPGVSFLEGVQVATREAAEWNDDLSDFVRNVVEDYTGAAHEIADAAVPVYTSDVWATFVDLQAWGEDITEFGDVEDMEQAAKAALYMIASRLVHALAEEIAELNAEEGE